MPTIITAFLTALFTLQLGSETLSQEPAKETRPAPLSPQHAPVSFQTSHPNIAWTQILSEPEIRQPVMATFDLAGRLWVVQYLQYPYPNGVKLLSRDNHWRTIYDKVPAPPIDKLEGQDIISVFRPSETGWVKERDFIAGLNITTAVAPDLDGVWVLNPPYLLYYPDQNRDLVPDGPPEVHLEGFGLEDTHSVVNSLRFGPDGWLYAAQGSTVTGAVTSYQSKESPIRSQGQNIWRYHPRTRQYEIFAEGGGNAFGVAFDDEGRLFSGHNGGDTRGFHYEQGGYYRKGFNKHGELSNPFTYGYLMPMHQAPFPRFTHTMLLTNGTQFEKQYPNAMLAVDPMHGQIIATQLTADSATYRTHDIEKTLESNDPWFRPVAIIEGPDGSGYVCDWYDIDIAHIHAYEGRLDRDRGRLYQLSLTSSSNSTGTITANPTLKTTDAWDSQLALGIEDSSLDYLITKLSHPYRWQRWSAVRLLAKHPLRESARQRIVDELARNSPFALDHLWVLHACGWLDDTLPDFYTDTNNIQEVTVDSDSSRLIPISNYFTHSNEHVRRWAIRLACDDRSLSEKNLQAINNQIAIEPSVQTLVQCAASLRRLPCKQTLQCLPNLLSRLEQFDSPTLNLMSWWCIENFASEFEALQNHVIQPESYWEYRTFQTEIGPRLFRRWLAMRNEIGMRNAELLLRRVSTLPPSVRMTITEPLHQSFETEYAGRSLADVTDTFLEALSELGEPSLSLKLRQGRPEAVRAAVEAIGANKTGLQERLKLLQILGELPQTAAQSTLEALALNREAPIPVREAAIRSLAKYDASELANDLLTSWSELPQELKVASAGYMSAKSNTSLALLTNIQKGLTAKSDVPLEMVRAMRLHSSTELTDLLDAIYPETALLDLRGAQEQVKHITDVLVDGNGDPYEGRKLYTQHCGRCHQLFQNGGDIGPDLTGYQRDSLDALLLNIVAPSLEIREGYETVSVQTTDGDVVVGFLESESESQIVLKGVDGQSHIVLQEEIEARKSQVESIMPQGLLANLSEQDLRNLFAYLRSPQPIGP